jgi:RHS repeat-associated protein
VEEKVYVGDYAVLTRPAGGSTRTNYLLKDRLGSVDTVTDANGAIAEQRGYDAFGKPRQGSWADLNPPRLSSISNTPRGFTQHEHLNSVELIHMNGRAFDYNLGRFLSVDPIIQFPTNSQSLNPYSYIMNNPLAGTDPTGFSFNSLCAHASNYYSSGTCGNFLAVAGNRTNRLKPKTEEDRGI